MAVRLAAKEEAVSRTCRVQANVPKEEIERLEQAIEVIEWIIGKVLEGE